MNILELPNGFDEVQFTNETVVIMAHQNKVITFNDSEEIWKIKYCLEEIADGMNNDGTEEYYQKDEALRCLIDQLEEESYFLEEKDIEPRYLKLRYLNEIEETDWNMYIRFYFGYLNSKDTYVSPNDYKLIADELKNFALNSGRCKPETKQLLVEFCNVLLDEYIAYENNSNIFKATIIE